ncbi:Helix-turn-helix domain-containing protein [Asanoa hainanensis]|uniref:Helix-turn-helix domain-containing protein n=1 Tax=Asanoa hainanensis TaxID=560556 RepID=A0A239PEP4_9ACTN|nr:Helix-turn-helix domain-containing protein [Asanoa hainanensis]
MDNRDEVRDFLTSRRERLTPEQAGVPVFGGKRRVKGLRREEVAMLAGMSTDYYTRLERGNLTGVSVPVLDGLARALQLDEEERTCSTWRTQPTPLTARLANRGARAAGPACVQACSGSSTRSAPRRTPATDAWTSWRPTASAVPFR